MSIQEKKKRSFVFGVTAIYYFLMLSPFLNLRHILPERCRNRILEFESSGLAVNFKRHQVDLGVVELDPSDVLRVGTEPDSSGVWNYLLFVDPVTNAIEDGSRNTFKWNIQLNCNLKQRIECQLSLGKSNLGFDPHTIERIFHLMH